MSVRPETAAAPDAPALPLRSSTTVQGNILAPFNKPFQRFVFLNFGNSTEDARRWLAGLLATNRVGSTTTVSDHNEAFKAAAESRGTTASRATTASQGETAEDAGPPPWVAVGLTSFGLVTLDPELAADLVAYDAFWQGPLVDREYRGERLPSPALVGDPQRGEPAGWVVGGPGQKPVDALVTIAADDPGGCQRVTEQMATPGRVTVIAWQDCEGRGGTEPFGFKDGISQPGVRGFTRPELRDDRLQSADQAGTAIIAPGEFVLGHDPEPGSYPAARRPVPPDWMRDGSFQVFLRIRQDVDGWTTQMAALRAASRDDVDVAARAIGRTADGHPLAVDAKDDDLNHFTYDDDPDGTRTPRFAHIRKMNPRNARFQDRTHRLLRRGIPFATSLTVVTPLDGTAPDGDAEEQGLAFNAFMASIEDQFEFLQRSWANNPESLPPPGTDGPDPVAGTSTAACVLRRPDKEPVSLHFGSFIWTSGAVYAFAPSLPTLRRLAGRAPAAEGSPA